MKKMLFVPFFLLVLLAGCKDDEVTPEVSRNGELLKGTWSNNFRTSEYYDDANQLAHKDTATVDVRFEFDGTNMKISNPGVEGVATYTYALPDTGKVDYIVISKNGKVENTYEIVSINESKMVWKQSWEYPTYQKDGKSITARKGTFTFDFGKL
jgi:hypothetical protein